jgi:hypothetical protein
MNTSIDSVQKEMMQMMNLHERSINCTTTINRHIRNTFGVTADVVVVIWEKIKENNQLNKKTRVKHVLWMLCYFKTYNEYEQYCNMFCTSEKTFRTWIWYIAGIVANLDIVSKKKFFVK